MAHICTRGMRGSVPSLISASNRSFSESTFSPASPITASGSPVALPSLSLFSTTPYSRSPPEALAKEEWTCEHRRFFQVV